MQRKARVICVGHTAFDRVYRVPAWPIGSAKVRALGFRESGGGMAANAAAAVALLGGDAHFWGPAGDDAIAAAMASELAALGVDVSGLRRVPGTRSSHSAILVDDRGERLIVGVRCAVLTASAEWVPLPSIEMADAVLVDVRWPHGAKRALIAARERRIPTVLDADIAERSVLEDLLPLSDYVVFSEPGLQAFANNAQSATLRQCLSASTRLAAVTRGARGLDWIDTEDAPKIQHLPAHPIAKAVDTTGAGDVFHGAFALAIAEDKQPALALDFARVAAALKCEREGARNLPARAAVEALVR